MTATLTAGELAEMQATAEENLPDSCRIVGITYTRDARGNETAVPALGDPFACRVRPLAGSVRQSAQEGLILQRLGVIEAWKIKAPKAIDVALQDKIEVTIGATVRTLEVVASPGLKSRQLIDSYVAVEIK